MMRSYSRLNIPNFKRAEILFVRTSRICLGVETHPVYPDGFFSTFGLEEMSRSARDQLAFNKTRRFDLVELTGIEPVTYGLQSRRSPS